MRYEALVLHMKGKTMAKIYDQHTAAFKRVSAYVVCNKEGRMIAKVAIKFPRDGAGRLYAYVHVIGLLMQRGSANGGGYDKEGAAVEVAAALIGKQAKSLPEEYDTTKQGRLFAAALNKIGGRAWDVALSDAGFHVHSAI